jgi:TonB-linked SusC/RagA family outer membrane protein
VHAAIRFAISLEGGFVNIVPPTVRRASIIAQALFLTLGAATTAIAQNGRITGTVLDSSAAFPVAGVNIAITGTTLSSVSGDNGRYTINAVPPGTYTVEARRLGYTPVRREGVVVTAGQTATVDFKVQSAALHLQETVITGVVDPTAGTKVPFTVGRVTKEDLPVPPANAITAIQGKIAGVAMIPPAQPGDGISIVLRSPSSINKGNTPLIVVDGVILSSIDASSADLNSLDIESVEVVKGAAGASLYGSRAANGVVQIRTSRGNGLSLGRTQFTLRSEYGGSAMSRDVERAQYHFYLVNSSGQYVNTAGQVVTRDNRVARAVTDRFQDVPYSTPVYNPVAEVFHPGGVTSNSLNIAQNGEKTNFLTTISRRHEDGVLRDHGAYDRTDFRINLDHRPRDDMQLSISGYHSRSNREELDPTNGSGGGNLFFNLTATAPDVNLLQKDPDGTKYIFQPDPQGVHPSPLYMAETQQNFTHRIRTLGSLDLRYAPLSWLSADANASYDRSDIDDSFWLDRGLKSENQATGDPGYLQLDNTFLSALNASATASVLKSFGRVVARSSVRALIEQQSYQTATASGTNFAVGGVPRLDAALSRTSSSLQRDIRAEGYFLTGGLDFDSRLILDGLVRRDASSLFGPGEQWHTYYRGSAAYRLAQEPWWPWRRINEFKLRASQGTAGTRPDFADQYETYTVSSNGTLAKSTLGNKNLKPETAKETEFGLDVILDDRYSLQLSRAHVRTTDELIAIPLPGALGFTQQWQNAGTVVGNTLEGTFEAQMLRRGSTSWKLGMTADRSRHHIAEFNRSCIRTATISYRCAGEDLSTMYGNAFVHRLQDLPTAQASATAGTFEVNDDGLLVAVGAGSHYTDKGKWGTSVVSNGVTYQWGMPIILLDSTGQQAVVKIGSGNPRFRYGVTNSITWKGFQFYGLLDTQVGGNVYNQNNQRSYQYQRSKDVDQVGKPDSLKKTIDYYSNVYNGNAIEDWFVEPGGFVKLRELSVRYRIPERFMRQLPGSRNLGADISVIGRNLKTWTRYSGYDPEAGTVINRLDTYAYPQYRTFTAVLQLVF